MRRFTVTVIATFAIHSLVVAKDRLPLESLILLQKLSEWEVNEKATLDKAIQKKRGEVALALMAQLKKVTQTGDLKTANLLQSEIDKLRNIKTLSPKKITVNPVEEGSSEIAVVSKSGLEGEIIKLKVGDPIYSNRDTTWAEIPPKLKDLSFHQVGLRDVSELKIKITVAGKLYCAFMSHQEMHKEKMEQLIADGWVKSPFVLKGNVSAQGDYIILEKQCGKGSLKIPAVHPAGGSILIFRERK